MEKVSSYVAWSFGLIMINLLAWFSILFSASGIMLLQPLLFSPIFILTPIASLILGIIGIGETKKKKLEGYKRALFSIIASSLSLIIVFLFGTVRLFMIM